MSAEFYLKTLGVPRLTTIAGHEVRIRVKKHLAVLIVLAVEGGKVRRDRLISMFWPTSRTDRARGSLATAISFLRGKLGGDAIEPGREYVELTSGLVALDLDRLEKGEILGDDFTPLLEVAGFLNGFEIESLPEFEAWRDRQQARLLPRVEQALLHLTEHSRRSGDVSRLARYADKLLELNDLSELGIKARMEAYALSGDRITALRVFDEWSRRLQEELGTVPAPSVADLANRLRRRNWDNPLSEKTVAPIRTEQWLDRLFIGRTKEYRTLYQIWEHAKRGAAQLVLIAGDSGIGKTTLADRLATALALEGTNVARVRCFELERSIPYAMIGGIIEALMERPGASGTSPESLAELSRVLPAVSRSFPNLPKCTDSSGESARIRFADAMMDFFNALLAECPMVVVVDDFDQADETSLALLHIAFRRLMNEPLFVLVTARTGRLSHLSINKLRPDEGVSNVGAMTLEPLDEEASAQLYAALVAGMPQVPNTTERRVLLNAAGGFPLALEILLRDWQRSGMRAVPLAVRAMTGDVDADPDSWSHQLAGTLNTEFADPERLVVYLASVLDRRVSDLSLYAAAGVPHGTILGAMSKLVNQRLLRDGPSGLEWINPTVRTQCYLLIPKALRKHFHEAVAAELLRQMTAGAAIPDLEIAWHCMRAGRHSEACRYIISGARQAIIQGAPHEAELALTSGMAVIDITNKEEATLVLVEAFLELSRPSEAVSLLSRTSQLTSRGSQTAHLLMVRARDQLSKLAVHEKEAVVRQICQLLLAGEDPATGVLAAWTGSDLVEGFGQNHLAIELLTASKAIDCSALLPSDLMRLRITQARLEYIPRRMKEAARLLKEALGIADAYNLRHSSYLQVLNGLGAIATATGQYEQGLEASKKHYTESVKAGDNRRASIACGNVAVCCCRLGRYREAIEWGQRAKGAPPSANEPPLNAEESIGLSWAMLGDYRLALESVEHIVQLAQRSPPPYLRKRMWLSAADVSMAVGESHRASGMAKEALSIPTDVALDLGAAGILARWQSIIAIEDGHVEKTAVEVRGLLRMPLDARDRAEVLASLKLLGCSSIEEDTLLQDALLNLPPALVEQFRRLGLILDGPPLHAGRGRKRFAVRRTARLPSQITPESKLVVAAPQEEAAV